jgi:hypothetical protein
MKACRVRMGRVRSLTYRMAAEPIPLSWPDPSEKILKSALSIASNFMESSLLLSILVEYLLLLLVRDTAGWMVSSLAFLSPNCFRSLSKGPGNFDGFLRLAFRTI